MSNTLNYSPGRRKKYDSRLRKQYGISLLQYEAMHEAQNGLCWICQQPEHTRENLAVDHDHGNGDVRGLLCRDCNRALGQFKDNFDIVQRAADYLKKGPANLIEQDEPLFKPHSERARHRVLVSTPDGEFDSLQSCADFYNVHSTTIRDRCGMNKTKMHLKRDRYTYKKVFK